MHLNQLSEVRMKRVTAIGIGVALMCGPALAQAPPVAPPPAPAPPPPPPPGGTPSAPAPDVVAPAPEPAHTPPPPPGLLRATRESLFGDVYASPSKWQPLTLGSF